MTALRVLRTFSCAESRPKAAAHRLGAPTARRLGCPQRNDLIFQGLGYHKALQSIAWIAAPRPDAARLCTQCFMSAMPPILTRHINALLCVSYGTMDYDLTPIPICISVRRTGAAEYIMSSIFARASRSG